MKDQNKKITNEDNLIPSNIYSEKILISNDTDFKNKIKEFLVMLDEKYKLFKFELEKLQNHWNSIKKERNVYIEPEQISIKSPTTILNAPWGTGKTYFIEQIAWYWNDEEIKNNHDSFKNFIVIDALKFITIPNILDSIFKYIYVILCKISTNNKNNKDDSKKFKKLKKFMLKAFVHSPKLIGSICDIFFPDLQLLNLGIISSNTIKTIIDIWNEDDNDYNTDLINDLNEINKDIEPSIIVFDNVERMGIHAWEIIKAIQQLSIFDKLIFLLPINKEQLLFNNNVEYNKKNESAIDKYITLGVYFDLKQNYLGILNELNFNDNDAQIINRILNDQINGYNLSIRLIKNYFLNNKIKESFEENKYNGLKEIKRIWNTNIIYEIINNDFEELKNDYNELDDFFKAQRNLFKEEITNIKQIIYRIKNYEYWNTKKELEELFEVLQEFENELMNSNYPFLKNIFFSVSNDWEEFLYNSKSLKKYLNQILNKNKKTYKSNMNQIKSKENYNDGFIKKIEEYKGKLQELENKNNSLGVGPGEPETQAEYKIKIKENEVSLNKNNKLINDWKINNQNIDNFNKEINLLTNNNSNGHLDNFIRKFEEIYNECNNKEKNLLLNDKNKSKMKETLCEVISLFTKENDTYYDYMSSFFEDKKTKETLIDMLLSD